MGSRRAGARGFSMQTSGQKDVKGGLLQPPGDAATKPTPSPSTLSKQISPNRLADRAPSPPTSHQPPTSQSATHLDVVAQVAGLVLCVLIAILRGRKGGGGQGWVAAGVAVLSGGVSAVVSVVCCGGEKGLQVFHSEKDSIDRVRRKLCVSLLAVQSTEAMPAGQAGRQWNPPTHPRTQQYQRHPAVPAAHIHPLSSVHPPFPPDHSP